MGEDQDEYSKMMELQRIAFEKQFGSLESLGYEDKTKTNPNSITSTTANADTDTGTDTDESTSGSDEEAEISAAEDQADALDRHSHRPSEDEPAPRAIPPRVIRFRGPSDTYVPPTKQEVKQLRTGKPLRQQQTQAGLLDEKADQEQQDDEEEAENLKNDLELQRFLQESHLLHAFDSAEYGDDSVMGKARSRALEMRLKGLSATNGREAKLNKLEKMPINVRKGMIGKHLKKIAQHEQEAKDGGVVLSRIQKGQFRKIDATYRNDIERRIGTTIKKQGHADHRKRQRGLKINSVGQSTKNGLVISKRDIDRINSRK